MVVLFSFHFYSNFQADKNDRVYHSFEQVYEQITEADSFDDGTDEDQIIPLSSKDGRPVNNEHISYGLFFNHFAYRKPPLLPPEVIV